MLVSHTCAFETFRHNSEKRQGIIQFLLKVIIKVISSNLIYHSETLENTQTYLFAGSPKWLSG